MAVTDGAVTLTGYAATYAQKLAAARAAERVEGVKAVANEIKVELAAMGRDDADIAAAIARILDWDVQIPEGTVHARVENGWVILAGEVGGPRDRTGKHPSLLDVADIDATLVAAFLTHLETERGNNVSTRNARLTAIYSLLRYAALRHPEHAESIQRVLAIPVKRHDQKNGVLSSSAMRSTHCCRLPAPTPGSVAATGHCSHLRPRPACGSPS